MTILEALIDRLSNQIYVNNNDGFDRSCKISIDTLNSFAPIKKKLIRANQMLFITKEFSREIKVKAKERLFTKESRKTCKLCKTK